MKLTPIDKPLLACRVCLSEIPASVADTAEGREYVHYFCGADCYLIWMQADAKGDDVVSNRAGTFCAA